MKWSNRQLTLQMHPETTCSQAQSLASQPIPWIRLWEIDIPRIEFTSSLALNALLAISAFDLSSRDPADQEIALASRVYFHKALKQHRQTVLEDNDASALPVLIASVLIVRNLANSW